MKKNMYLLIGLLFLLVGCGGGGGGGGGGVVGDTDTNNAGEFPITSIQLNSPVNGNMSTADIYLDYGQHGDLYKITLSESSTLNVRMDPPELDPVLYLFPSEVLSIADMDDWQPYLEDFSLIGDMTADVAAGTWVIVASNYPFTAGDYTLTATTRHSVTATAGTGGSVSPTASTVDYGATASFSVTTDTGFTRNDTVGGTCPSGTWAGDTYTTGAIKSTCSLDFSFTSMN